MEYKDLLDGWKRFGTSSEDVCLGTLGVSPDEIHERVIIAPWWEPDVFDNLGNEKTYLSKENSITKVWNIQVDECLISYIKTGIGAPVVTDAVLALAGTKCKKALFVGSVGALDLNLSIGDIVVPMLSICGDGISRYLKGKPLKSNDPFGELSYPDAEMFKVLSDTTREICQEYEVQWHIGKTFSVDTIVAQFPYIDEIMNMGCNVIEMETAAAFRAATLVNLKLAALFSVSDNTLKNKSLLSGREDSEMNYRKEVRKNIFPKIILKTLL
ncbi:phosphorylase family protein [Alkaliphilus serpentinus]|uniref:Nucleoside phosphorylase n=1 Tax=Alkaliphilus serpentinus TaxID=1482731 RepID=A0A833HNF0_9FIRM|nr:phosphorylase [Alkaliphilus serpentinus]KAB3529516.1 nucleoside phosphorylase [Alkaliphilus serpentinus]